MKIQNIVLGIVFVTLLLSVAFADELKIDRREFDETEGAALIGLDQTYRESLAGLSLLSALPRNFLNFSMFYEKTHSPFSEGEFGLGGEIKIELEVIPYRAGFFFKAKGSYYREESVEGFEGFLWGAKFVFARNSDDSFVVNSFGFVEIPALEARGYIPKASYVIGSSLNFGVSYNIAFREFVYFGADFDNVQRIFSRTELAFYQREMFVFGGTSVIISFELEFLLKSNASDRTHFEAAFSLFNETGIYYEFAWRFGNADKYRFHHQAGIYIKF